MGRTYKNVTINCSVCLSFVTLLAVCVNTCRRSFQWWLVVLRHNAKATGVWLSTCTVKDLSTREDCRGISQEVHWAGSSGHGFAMWGWIRRRRGMLSVY